MTADTANGNPLARAERKLSLLEERLAALREEYREAEEEGAHPTELRLLVERGQELVARVEQRRQWVAEREEGSVTE